MTTTNVFAQKNAQAKVATQKKYITDGKVSFRNLIVNAKEKTFSIDFAFIEGRQKKFNYQTVSGNMTPELYDWFTKSFLKLNSYTCQE